MKSPTFGFDTTYDREETKKRGNVQGERTGDELSRRRHSLDPMSVYLGKDFTIIFLTGSCYIGFIEVFDNFIKLGEIQ